MSTFLTRNASWVVCEMDQDIKYRNSLKSSPSIRKVGSRSPTNVVPIQGQYWRIKIEENESPVQEWTSVLTSSKEEEQPEVFTQSFKYSLDPETPTLQFPFTPTDESNEDDIFLLEEQICYRKSQLQDSSREFQNQKSNHSIPCIKSNNYYTPCNSLKKLLQNVDKQGKEIP